MSIFRLTVFILHVQDEAEHFQHNWNGIKDMNKERTKFTTDLYFFNFHFLRSLLSMSILWFIYSDETGKVCTKLQTVTYAATQNV